MKKIFPTIVVAAFAFFSQALSPRVFAQASETIYLEKPPEKFGIDLKDAFQKRHSTKAYEKKEIPLKDLGSVFWAANGINRENGKRTAPAPRGFYLVQIFYITEKGVFLYQAKEHALRKISDKNIMDKVAKQPYLADSSGIIALVLDLKLYEVEEDREKILFGATTAGCIAQNVYLAANALGLGTCLVAGLNGKELRDGLSLNDDQIPIFLMPLGYPKP